MWFGTLVQVWWRINEGSLLLQTRWAHRLHESNRKIVDFLLKDLKALGFAGHFWLVCWFVWHNWKRLDASCSHMSMLSWSSEFLCRLGLLFRNPKVRHPCCTEGRGGQRIQGLKESSKGRDQWMNHSLIWFDLSIDFFESVLSQCFSCYHVYYMCLGEVPFRGCVQGKMVTLQLEPFCTLL